MTHESYFKHDQKSRMDDRLEDERAAALEKRRVHAIVDTRDKRQCRACQKRANPDAIGLLRGHRHHIVYRSALGPTVSENLATLCASCHNDEHRHRFQIEGDADDKLTFWRKDPRGIWYVWRREVSVGIFEKD